MSAVALLTELSARGCTLRRLSGDRLQVTGTLPPSLSLRLKDAKPELLAIYPDPDVEICRTWAEAVEDVNATLSHYPHWQGTPEQWAEHDRIEGQFNRARADGDIEAAHAAADGYRQWAMQAWRIEAAHAFAEEEEWQNDSH